MGRHAAHGQAGSRRSLCARSWLCPRARCPVRAPAPHRLFLRQRFGSCARSLAAGLFIRVHQQNDIARHRNIQFAARPAWRRRTKRGQPSCRARRDPKAAVARRNGIVCSVPSGQTVSEWPSARICAFCAAARQAEFTSRHTWVRLRCPRQANAWPRWMLGERGPVKRRSRSAGNRWAIRIPPIRE